MLKNEWRVTCQFSLFVFEEVFTGINLCHKCIATSACDGVLEKPLGYSVSYLVLCCFGAIAVAAGLG